MADVKKLIDLALLSAYHDEAKKAENVVVADTAENFEGTSVEAILAELAGMIGDTESAGALTITKSTPEGVAARYTFKQGDTTLDQVIDIPKDMVISSGTVENVTEDQIGTEGYPVAESPVGKYIKIVVANGDTLWIPVGSLVDIYTPAENADQIQVAISNTNVISAEIVDGSVDNDALGVKAVSKAKLNDDLQASIDKADSALQDGASATKIEYKANTAEEGQPSNAVSVAKAIEDLEAAIGAEGSVAGQITAAIEDLDSTVTQTAGQDGVAVSIEQEDGKLKSVSVSIAEDTYDTAGAASTVKSDLLGDADNDTVDSKTIEGTRLYAKSVADGAVAALQYATEQEVKNLFALAQSGNE